MGDNIIPLVIIIIIRCWYWSANREVGGWMVNEILPEEMQEYLLNVIYI